MIKGRVLATIWFTCRVPRRVCFVRLIEEDERLGLLTVPRKEKRNAASHCVRSPPYHNGSSDPWRGRVINVVIESELEGTGTIEGTTHHRDGHVVTIRLRY